MDSLIRGCNVYVFQTSQRLRLDSFKLPTLKREMVDHLTGGGFFKVDLPAEVSPLEAEMTVHGNPGDLRSRFGREPGDWTDIAYYEALLDATTKSGGPSRKGRVVMLRGLLTEVDQPSVEGLKAKDKTKVKIASIVLYHDVVDGKTIHKFDVFKNTLVLDGTNYSADHNRIIAA